MSLSNNSKSKKSSVIDQVLSNSLFSSTSSNESNISSEKDPLASCVWRMYTNAKDSLPNGSRIENLTWRMMAMILTKKKLKEEETSERVDTMDIDNNEFVITPPLADDITGLLSSSAPPYINVGYFKDQQHNNVMISGSTRAITISDNDVPRFTVKFSTHKKYIEYGLLSNQHVTDTNSITIPLDEDDEQGLSHNLLNEESFHKPTFSQTVLSDSSLMQNMNMIGNTNFPASTYQLETNNSTLLFQNQPSPPPSIPPSSLYYGVNPSYISSSVEIPIPTAATTTTKIEQDTTASQHPGALSFENILNAYYNNSNNSLLVEDTGLKSSRTSLSLSPHSISSSDYEEENPLSKPVRTGKYKRSKTLIHPSTSTPRPNTSLLTQCSNCQTTTTPLWRRDPQGNSLCNACGLFLKLHGSVRPLSLKTDVIKKRNRNSTHNIVNNNNNQLNNSRLHSKIYSKKQMTVDPTRDKKPLLARRNTVHITPQLHLQPQQTTKNSIRSMPTAGPSHLQINNKKQQYCNVLDRSPLLKEASPFISSINNTTTYLSPMMNNLSPETQFGAATTTTATNQSVVTATNIAVNAILESVGIHLESFPAELLPLIASAANYHAAAKRRKQEEQENQ
ncbi:uncharacterized protein BX663DRAFT_508208 [Cokeromyces recurvatus]|uniref:uncharacterized protein n=1 Tax=Cokeromyces recurvatus TaxID=90255 RepID=UPI002220858D|nr:uncharacterized protein BX663DRAFT_508208 [Cokeromyces recurvatus]KAI7903320.1 hypothetical protein BX663DRAFT_508208 [Cokeromyces recurvatus]